MSKRHRKIKLKGKRRAIARNKYEEHLHQSHPQLSDCERTARIQSFCTGFNSAYNLQYDVIKQIRFDSLNTLKNTEVKLNNKIQDSKRYIFIILCVLLITIMMR